MQSSSSITQRFRRASVSRWTREKIEALSTPEVRDLRDNAVRLGETEIAALCDEVLDTRPRGHLPKRRGEGRKLVSRNQALGLRGVRLRNRTWSRGAVRESDGSVVLVLRAGEVRAAGGASEALLWAPNVDGSHEWSDTPGGKERLDHCRRALTSGAAEGLLVYDGRRPGAAPVQKARGVEKADPEAVLHLRVEMRNDEYWATWNDASAAAT